MTTRSWLRNLFASRTARTIRRAPARSRPALEVLEDRTVLTTITPTIFNDPLILPDNGGLGSGSLRAAILNFNMDSGTTTDTINLNSGTYSLTLQNPSGQQQANGYSGELAITSTAHKLIIQGQVDANGKPGADTIDFAVTGTIKTVTNSTLSGNQAHTSGNQVYGGGIANRGTLTLSSALPPPLALAAPSISGRAVRR